MSLKAWVRSGLLVGSTVGGYVPMLWGESAFSLSGLIGSCVGGIVGVWAGYQLNKRY